MKEQHTMIRSIIISFGILWLVMQADNAQAQYDPMFTQYMNNEMYINPGYAGSRGYISTMFLARSQWVGIEGAPKTQTFSIHSPIKKKKLGIGLIALNEKIGVTSKMSAMATIAYRLPVSENSTLAFGLQGGILSLQEDLSELIPSDGNHSDPIFLNNTPRRAAPKAGFGMYYSNDHAYLGWSIPRLINSSIDPIDGFKVNNEVQIDDWHHYITAGYVFSVNNSLKLKPTIMGKAVHGAPVEIDVNMNALLNELLWLGISYRTRDAVNFLISLNATPQLRLGYSYDYTLTELQSYTSGSHEITIGFDFNTKRKGVSSIRYF